jgi:hypothetical protein
MTADHLEPTSLQISDQKYALVSIIGPSSNQRNDSNALKIYGVFSNTEEANSHAKKLQQVESDFDVFLVELYKWLPVPPDAESIKDQQYQDNMLNSIVTGYLENHEKAQVEFDVRKNEMLNSIQNEENLKVQNSVDEGESSQHIENETANEDSTEEAAGVDSV